MLRPEVPEAGESAGVYGTFTFKCRDCGSTVHVIDTVRQEHDCPPASTETPS